MGGALSTQLARAVVHIRTTSCATSQPAAQKVIESALSHL